MASTILPPIPDRLISPARKDEVIGFLIAAEIPSRYARAWLGRWAAAAGVELTRDDFNRVSRQLVRRAPE